MKVILVQTNPIAGSTNAVFELSLPQDGHSRPQHLQHFSTTNYGRTLLHNQTPKEIGQGKVITKVDRSFWLMKTCWMAVDMFHRQIRLNHRDPTRDIEHWE
jgi:hypothetical protein